MQAVYARWLAEDDCAQSGRNARLAEVAPRTFVLTRRPFIELLLRRAATCGPEITHRIEGPLKRATFDNYRARLGLGEPEVLFARVAMELGDAEHQAALTVAAPDASAFFLTLGAARAIGTRTFVAASWRASSCPHRAAVPRLTMTALVTAP